MSIAIMPHEDGLDHIRAQCVMCGDSAMAPIDPADRWIVAVAVMLRHRRGCPVPPRLAQAFAAKWN